MSDGAGSERQLLPRLCRLEKGPNGYGFHLHGEKGKVGQFIRLVEPDSPAQTSGLRPGDRLVEVNGENVEKESHQQVVSRIRAALGAVRLLVVDPETDEQLQKLGVQCREEMIHGLPAGGPEKLEEKSNEEPQEAPREQVERPGGEEKSHPAERVNLGHSRGGEGEPSGIMANCGQGENSKLQKELRPRLCLMKKGPNGYGFNLHSDKTKPGQYIRAVDPDSPAESSGLCPQDRIIEVNGQCMEGKQHSDVVTAIKAGGDETKLLVVDSLTDEFFKKCKVVPSEEHLTGPLPEPVANGEVEKEDSREQRPESVSESPSSPEPMAVSPSLKETYNESDSQEKEEKRNSTPDPLLDLNVPLAVAKERAHQKRTSKRAPQMDWSKKNELFSNL